LLSESCTMCVLELGRRLSLSFPNQEVETTRLE
jgi:hypothetical protein